MLIDSPRLTDADRAAWPVLAMRYRQPRWLVEQRAREARNRILRFAAEGSCHVGVSWGKDSVVVAHLARAVDADIPLVWVRLGEADNPDCAAVRTAYLCEWPSNYAEVEAPPATYVDGSLVTGARRGGYALAEEQFGDRRITGIRAQESSTRAMSAAVHGVATDRSCRPILHWTTAEVFAHLLHYDLPIHPAYAMTMGGQLDMERLRVASIGGLRGRGAGRREWELTYYGDRPPYTLPAPSERA